jgi:antitoxin component of RelBE/YafQ-DinJ toxin-antitoxin module
MSSLFDKVTEKEEQKTPKAEKKAVKKIAKNNVKDKVVSAKFNSDTYKQFSEINTKMGITNNSALNMILAQYVKEHSDWLEEE